MHSALIRLALAGLVAATLPAALRAQQVTVGGGAVASDAVQRAEQLARGGQPAAAQQFLGRHLAESPSDGRAWFYLGRLYLTGAEGWHREGHPRDIRGGLLLDFASAAFQQAHQLLADSGNVYQALTAVERATLRIEESEAGWGEVRAVTFPPEEVPLPPVISELGRNLLASCPREGVLVTGALIETAAAWGIRLLDSTRADLVLIRPDLYRSDAVYRERMAKALGVAPATELPAALAEVAARRPVCLTPSAAPLATAAAGVEWRPLRLVLVAGPVKLVAQNDPLTVHQLARTGLAGSVWSVAARDVYELAARRNTLLCRTLFEAEGLPTIPACSR